MNELTDLTIFIEIVQIFHFFPPKHFQRWEQPKIKAATPFVRQTTAVVVVEMGPS